MEIDSDKLTYLLRELLVLDDCDTKIRRGDKTNKIPFGMKNEGSSMEV